ncbi:ABC transporter ATP-binding protein [Microbacterium awajiense]|uniref:ABC transporter ATP-binding protein n=1 Tax=Microbacterium awajiense TaxID=415214 RepID=A0ABP7AVZ5_9MICO
MSVVRVRGLSIDLRSPRRYRRVVDEVDFDIDDGETFGIVGASGSGKSTIAWALAGHFARHARVSADRLEIDGLDVLSLDRAALRRHRRAGVAIVPQEPQRALDPTARIGPQVARAISSAEDSARPSVIEVLAEVGLDEPESIARRFPHEVSGGQAQRIVLAMALARRPGLLILDEPTAGLDAVSREAVLSTIGRTVQRRGSSVLLISHDLTLVAAHSDRVGILVDGRVVETRPAESLFSGPRHPWTRGAVAIERSRDAAARRNARSAGRTVVDADGVGVRYGGRPVLEGIRLRIERGETLGLVGETGSGKTTLGRAIAGLIPHSGEVVIDAPDVPPPVQIVWQNADASLNPRRTVGQTLSRAIRLLDGQTTPLLLAERTGLTADALDKLPHQLSGGEKQRVALARAFAGRSAVVVCDEPTSALDPHNRELILDLIVQLQETTGAACLFISHDLAVVRRVSHRVAVLRDGRMLETVSAAGMDVDARHAYTRNLIAATRRLASAGAASPHGSSNGVDSAAMDGSGPSSVSPDTGTSTCR